MIRNGYYEPEELFNKLVHFDYDYKYLLEKSKEDAKNKTKDTLKLLQGDCAQGIVIGNRTGGKTVGIARKLLKRYLEYGERSLICCRTIDQIKAGFLEKWWQKSLRIDDNENFFPGLRDQFDIRFDRDAMYFNDEVVSYSGAMSAAFKIKNEGSYERCTKLVIDEAMLPNEPSLRIQNRSAMTLVYTIWQTMARGWKYAVNESSIIFISNSTEFDNWIFNDLGVNKWWRTDAKKMSKNGIFIEKINNTIASEALDSSVMAKIMENSVSGKIYKDMAQNSTFADNTAFIEKHGLDFSKLKLQIVEGSYCVGLFDEGETWHAAVIRTDDRAPKICNNPLFHSKNVAFEPNGKWNDILRTLYVNDRMTFNDQRSKNAFLAYVKYM